jgi:dTDP-4-amino-4,6-dideoxygalactose transaminase
VAERMIMAEKRLNCPHVLLTQSYSAAMDMAAMLSQVGPGDEVIMPSFAFVSVANAFHMRGATPVFVDIRPDTLNLDETLVEQAVTDQTKVIVVPHYAGIGSRMKHILTTAKQHKLLVVEDAADHLGWKAKYDTRDVARMMVEAQMACSRDITP